MTALAAAVILAGGRGDRLGGTDKPALRLGPRSLLDICLDAVRGCPTVVVGPPRELPAEVIATREHPAGGGPAAAVAAGIAALPPLPSDAVVAVLAADLPGIDRATIARLTAALTAAEPDGQEPGGAEPGGAVLVDDAGRRQYLIGTWRLDRLRAAMARRPDWSGAPLRRLLEPIDTVEVAAVHRESADVDTPEDWRRWQS